MKGVRSPLTGNAAVTLVRELRVDDVVADWNRVTGIDVRAIFGDRKTFTLYRCNETGLLFFWPREIAGPPSLYEELEREEWYCPGLLWEHRAVMRRLHAGDRVLDIGCGRGDFLKAADARGCTVAGIDTNVAAVRQLHSDGYCVHALDVESFAVSTHDRFDVVTAFQVLEHLPDPLPFLRAALSLLREGGQLILGVPHTDGYMGRRDIPLECPPHHMLRWPKSAIYALQKFLPVTLESLRIEPLAPENIDGYLHAYGHDPSTSWRKIFLRLGLRFFCEGHTLLATCIKYNAWNRFLPAASEIVDDLDRYRYSAADYDRVRDDVAEQLMAISGVRCVAGYGAVSLPGISDIDLLVICDDDTYISVRDAAEKIRRTYPDGAFFFPHQFFILPVFLVRDRETLFMQPLSGQLRAVRGDAALLTLSHASPHIVRINQYVWSTTLRRVIMQGFGPRPMGLRDMLLRYQSIVTAIATLRFFRSDTDERMSVVTAAKQERAAIASAAPLVRIRMALSTITHALDRLQQEEWETDKWWSRNTQQTVHILLTDAPGAEHLLRALSGSWKKAFIEYRAALQRAMEFGTRFGNTHLLFLGDSGGTIPSPFNALGR